MRRRNVKDRRASQAEANSAVLEKQARKPENTTFIYALIAAAILTAGIYYYISSVTNETAPTKSILPNASLANPFPIHNWGSFRSHMYFGLRTRHPNSPLFGLMWYKQPIVQQLKLRHWCKQEDNVRYMWLDSDGDTFGHQRIQDAELGFETNWLGNGKSFAAEVNMYPVSNVKTGQQKYAFAFYIMLPDEGASVSPNYKKNNGFVGWTPDLGKFRLWIEAPGTEVSFATVHLPPRVQVTNIEAVFQAGLRFDEKRDVQLGEINLGLEDDDPERQNLAFIQVLAKDPTRITVHFDVEEAKSVTGSFPVEFAKTLEEFRETFEEKFELKSTSFPPRYETMARAALSNMLGSIGYWHGYAEVAFGKTTVPYGPLTLFSAVPSRPFFPRPFLWDEGFHNLLIKQFDPEKTLNIIANWLDSMDSMGWMPREMIVDAEARARVPAEFIVQSSSVANPPMFFYVIESLMQSNDFMVKHSRRLVQFYPRLKQWYLWLKRTQSGPNKGTFRWRGRNETTNLELNPKTLPSGLDDFPRSTHPNNKEYHLDLLCWMALSSRTLRQIAEYSSDTAFMPEIEEDMELFNSVDNLNKWHWNAEKQRYFDYGLHSDNVALVEERHQDQTGQVVTTKRRVVHSPPRLRHVDNVYGYLNLFPFLLRVLPASSENLGIILKSLKNEKELWTDYGLRSLSSRSPYYMRYNTMHDGPYWRGPIWMNMNYLTLAALKHYQTAVGPYSEVAGQLYSELRHNIITNIAEQYHQTGYFWEHYNDKTGRGGGSHPFTGWTALIVNILTEKYV